MMYRTAATVDDKMMAFGFHIGKQEGHPHLCVPIENTENLSSQKEPNEGKDHEIHT